VIGIGAAEDRRRPDLVFASIAVVLAIFGVAVSSSARVFEDAVRGSGTGGLLQSLLHVAAGLLVMCLVSLPDYRKLHHPALLWFLLAGTGLLLALPLFGPEINGTHRWIRFAGISLQPSELAKPVLVVAVAATLARAGKSVRTWSGLSRPLLVCGLIAGLALLGGDLGTPTLMFLTTLVMVFVAGGRVVHFVGLIGAGALVFAGAVRAAPYRQERLLAFLDGVTLRAETVGQLQWQLKQSIIAIGSGGLLGKGFGSSTQKAFFLPEADNDFVFAVIGEELGLIVALVVLAAFLVIAWRGVHTAFRASDDLGRLLALGASFFLVAQALCHIGVVTGILPTKGLPLPFLSTGGSSLVSSFALVGLLLNVSQRRRVHA